MSFQTALKTLEQHRSEAEAARNEARKYADLAPSVYDYWSGREAGLADVIAQLTTGVRPITREEAGFLIAEGVVLESNILGTGTLGFQLEQDFKKHRTPQSDDEEDR